MKLKNALYIGMAILLLSACSNAVDDDQYMTDNGGQNGAPGIPIEISNFEECVAAGNPVMESYPRQCTHEGVSFVEDIEPLQSTDENPCPDTYEPVCGEVKELCIECSSVKITFVNQCEAEKLSAKNITEGECVDEGPNPEGACLSFDGNWIDDHNECEGMSQEMCDNLGGSYNECASACRHNPEAEVCTMQCVQVCKF